MTELETLLVEALRLAVDMRAAQARYFKARRDSEEKRDALRQSVTLERKFDALAVRALRRHAERHL
jgi:hypothetical protein